ncbi:MAG TPA: DUF1697 domain-containing protein [Chroococcales cyanobacterium]
MARYSAFLRGINVGGRIIKMNELKTCLTEIGLKDVKTILQSGNVVFDSPVSAAKLKNEIEVALTNTFGYPAKVQIYPIEILKQIVQDYPFGQPVQGSHDYVIFMENKLEAELAAEAFSAASGELIGTGSGVVYRRVEKGLTLDTEFAKLLTKSKYKQFNTARNLNTLQKMLK